MSIAKVRKALVAVVGAIASIAAQGVLTGAAQHWAVSAVAVATALGVYGVKNAS